MRLTPEAKKARVDSFMQGGTYREMGQRCGMSASAFRMYLFNNNYLWPRKKPLADNTYTEELKAFEFVFRKFIQRGHLQTGQQIDRLLMAWNRQPCGSEILNELGVG